MNDARTRAGVARLFFALVPDSALRAELAALGRALAEQTDGRASPEANLHLTVAFMGDVATHALPAAQSLLGALPGCGFALCLDRLGAWKHAGVAWVGPSHIPEALGALSGALAAALGAAGFAVDARPFRPHVTLVRRCRRPLAPLPCAPLGWRVSALSLMQSEVAARGVRYRELARRDFEG
jgi:2'-5' RNA ligase